jgi:uncharacterized protein YrrD
MTALSTLIGANVVSRASAEELGTIHGVVVDVAGRTVTAWQIGKGRRAHLVDHAHLTGMGAAAVVVDDEANLRAPSDAAESATVKGHRALLGATALSDAGDVLGVVEDAEIDTDTGAILSVQTPAGAYDCDRLLGFGQFALVIDVPNS